MGMAGGLFNPVGKLLTALPIKSGLDQAKMQKRALQDQQAAQDTAYAQVLKQERQNAMDRNKANRKQPDLGAILASAQEDADLGVGSTLLGGTYRQKKLGRSTLLGG